MRQGMCWFQLKKRGAHWISTMHSFVTGRRCDDSLSCEACFSRMFEFQSQLWVISSAQKFCNRWAGSQGKLFYGNAIFARWKKYSNNFNESNGGTLRGAGLIPKMERTPSANVNFLEIFLCMWTLYSYKKLQHGIWIPCILIETR